MAKLILVKVLYYLGILRFVRWIHRHHLIIITYHGVLPSDSLLSPYLSRNFVETEMFRWQMEYLANHYTCMTLSEAVKGLMGQHSLPPYSLVVTFDDGFKNNYLYAFPILQEYKIPATIFLATGHIGGEINLLWTEKVAWLIHGCCEGTIRLESSGNPIVLNLNTQEEKEQTTREFLKFLKGMEFNQRESLIDELEGLLKKSDGFNNLNSDRYAFLDWREVQVMTEKGIEFGGHTVNHAILTTLNSEQRLREVGLCKEEIERHSAKPCLVFSYPNGTRKDFGLLDKENLKKLGYICAGTQIPGVNSRQEDLFELRRVNVGLGHSPLVFIAQISGIWPIIQGIFRRN